MPANNPMVSEVSICNQALTWLGQTPITSLDDQIATAEWMRANYYFLRDAVIEERNWTFATTRAKSETADKDDWGIRWKHGIPDGFMSVFRCYMDVSAHCEVIDTSWVVEGEFILSDYSTVYLWGLKRVTDTGKFSPLFAQALAARIAADAAIPLTENRRLQADMWALYGDKLAQAAARDGQQGSNELVVSNKFIDARVTAYQR